MKTNKITVLLMLIVFFTACEVDENKAPVLSVSVDAAQVVNTMNDTTIVYKGQQIKFNISGNPDMITFFSGESTHKYAFKDRLVAPGTPKMDFYFTPNRVTTANQVDVLVSLNFKGVYDSLNIRAAKWDTLTTPEMNAYRNIATAKVMPTIDLTKYGNGQPMFVAFRLIIKSFDRYVNPAISAFQIRNYQTDGNISLVVDKMSSAGMSFVTLSENAKWKLNGGSPNIWKVSSEALTVNTAIFPAVTTGDLGFNASDGRSHELWAISKVLYLDKATPDTGVTIKDITKAVDNYNYTYSTSGVYRVSFVAANTGPSGVLSTTLKELIVKVIDKP